MRILAIPFISFLLVSILMTSVFVPFLGQEHSTAIILNASEEENNSHDTSSSKVFDNKCFVSKNFFTTDSSINQEKNDNTLGYVFTVLEFTLETLDPPPRRLI
ncbi:hypothetical protein [Allomuricauda sp. F6463D]|uniref:hypothetical protein n=1 Tax=Allomuricauda sp. F6463D TaxID=2926409 RepID=UPI001FF68F6A|nr:hypothetical protein [Muricauda sp. F6463D]MCK0161340.1 hypothetical protein [Muricauda sp. F6463D]